MSLNRGSLGRVCLVVVACCPGAMGMVSIDEILHRPDARHGTFGPTGKRLFTERLDEGLGLRGQFCYIHYADIRDPIRIELHKPGGPTPVHVEQVDWYPSHVVVRSRVGQLTLTERKFITDDDTLVDLIELKNESQVPAEYSVAVTSGFATEQGATGTLAGAGEFYGVRAHGVIAAGGFLPNAGSAVLNRLIRVMPGESQAGLAIAMAMNENVAAARQTAEAWLARPNALEHHRKTYQQWFDENCPSFECDDPAITKMYWYRWFVARHCLSRACTGGLPHPYFFEGTHQSHFSRLIAFSSPHIITEARWLHDPQYAFGQVRNHCLNADDENRFFISARINGKGGDYNNWIAASAWGAFCVHPDRAWLAEVIDGLVEDVRGTFRQFDPDGNKLCTPRNHWTTGMEFQPAFFFFNDYNNTKPDARLERGDFAAYTFSNAKALADACRLLGDDDRADEFERLAAEIRHACLSRMWDKDDRFCYAIRESDGATARVREIVGFYPFAGRLFPNEPDYTAALAYLVDPDEFWTPFPPATVTRKCPAYTPKIAHWPAAGGKTHGCMWNGPAWPHATSTMLDVAAAAVQDYDQPYIKPEHFWHMFQRYTRLQYENGELNRPLTTEYYNGETGDPDPKGCPDYFHSTYCDLVIKYVAGLQPANVDRLTLRPIPGPVRRFSLRRVRYRGHDVDITYNAAGSAGEPAGLTLWIAGRRAAHRATLGELTAELSQSTSSR